MECDYKAIDVIDPVFMLARVLAWAKCRNQGPSDFQKKTLWRAIQREQDPAFRNKENTRRRRQELRAPMRWMATELFRYWVYEDRRIFKQHRLEVERAAKINKVGLNRKVSESLNLLTSTRFATFALRMARAHATMNCDWLTPGICFEQHLNGHLGHGDWFGEYHAGEIPLRDLRGNGVTWPCITVNQAFLTALPFVWNPPMQPRRRALIRIELNEWLGAAEVAIHVGAKEWLPLAGAVRSMIEALKDAGALICKDSGPSPRGGRWTTGFLGALKMVKDHAESIDPSAKIVAWADGQKILATSPSRWRNLDESLDDSYGMKLEETEKLRAYFWTELKQRTREQVTRDLLKRGVPADLIENWYTFPGDTV